MASNSFTLSEENLAFLQDLTVCQFMDFCVWLQDNDGYRRNLLLQFYANIIMDDGSFAAFTIDNWHILRLSTAPISFIINRGIAGDHIHIVDTHLSLHKVGEKENSVLSGADLILYHKKMVGGYLSVGVHLGLHGPDNVMIIALKDNYKMYKEQIKCH